MEVEQEQEQEEEEEAEDKTLVSYFSFSPLVLHVGHTNPLRDLVPLSLSDEALMPFLFSPLLHVGRTNIL